MKKLYQGKMAILLFLIALVCGTSAVSIMPELKHNVLPLVTYAKNITNVCAHMWTHI